MTRPTTIRELSIRVRESPASACADQSMGLLASRGLSQTDIKVLQNMRYHASNFRHYVMSYCANAETLAQRPEQTGCRIVDTALAALAEYLARLYGLNVPRWSEDPVYVLAAPTYLQSFFREDIRQAVWVATPFAWRRRNLILGPSAFGMPESFAGPRRSWE